MLAHDRTIRPSGYLLSALLLALALHVSAEAGPAPVRGGRERAHALPTYTVAFTHSPPVIDGEVSEPSWQQAEAITSFHCFGPKQGRPTLGTTAKVLWDKRYLYVAFQCTDTDVWSVRRERDTQLWEGEVVEIYVDADGDGRNYKEFEVNPLNAVIDLNIVKPRDGNPGDWRPLAQWDSVAWKTAVLVDGTLDNRRDADRGWSCEMAIPLSDLSPVPVRKGDRWRVQLLRIERANTLDRPEFSAWSPTDTFHRPERFGIMTFIKP